MADPEMADPDQPAAAASNAAGTEVATQRDRTSASSATTPDSEPDSVPESAPESAPASPSAADVGLRIGEDLGAVQRPPVERGPRRFEHDSPVVGVVVARNPGPSLADTLASLAAQDHPAFSLLVIDDASDVPITDTVAAVVPSAFVTRLDAPIGYGAAANLVSTMVAGAAFFVFCHDDVALASDAVRLLVAESIRSDAAIVGPKLVGWSNHERLLSVGMEMDRAGTALERVARGERDQGQHDVAGEVTAISGATLLIRSDVFVALGGFDPATTSLRDGDVCSLGPDVGEDVDLCWRARVAGQRITVEPAARVAHLGAVHGPARPVDRNGDETIEPAAQIVRQAGSHRERNRIRSVFVTTSAVRLPLIVPVLLLQSLWRTLTASSRSTTRLSGPAFGIRAWAGVLRERKPIGAARRKLDASRRLAERDDLKALLPIGARGRAAVRDDVFADSARLWNLAEHATTLRSGRVGLFALALGALAWFVGSRGLLFGDVPTAGQLVPLDGAGPLVRALSHAGSGASSSAAAAALPFLGVLVTLALGARSVALGALVAGSLAVGAVTVWRLVPTFVTGESSRRRTVQVLVTLAYVGCGLGTQAIGAGRLDACVTFALFPLVVSRLRRAVERRSESAAADSERDRARRGPSAFAHRVVVPVLPLGVVLSVLVAFAPGAVVAVAMAAVALAVMGVTDGFGSVSESDRKPVRLAVFARVLSTALLGLVIGALLLLPWTVDAVRSGRSLGQLTIGPLGSGLRPPAHQLLRLSATEPASGLRWGMFVAASVALLIGSGPMLRSAMRGWILVLCSIVPVWFATRGWIPMVHPLVALVPAALGLSIAGGLGASVLAGDVRTQRFGWRQLVTIAGFAAFVVSLAPTITAAGTGRWGLPERGIHRSLSWMAGEHRAAPFRTVWVGSPRILPIAGRRLEDDLAFGVSSSGLPSTGEQWPTRSTPSLRRVATVLDAVAQGASTRAGSALGGDGVRYVVVVSKRTPTGRSVGATADLRAALAQQFDLRPIETIAGLSVFENATWAPSPRLARVDAPKGAKAMRSVQVLLWVLTAGVLLRQRKQRRGHEALLIEQERRFDEPDDRIGDVFATSFSDVDEEAAFAELLERQAAADVRSARRTTARSGAAALPGRSRRERPQSGGAPSGAGAEQPVLPSTSSGTAGSSSAPVALELPEDGSLADALWEQWSARQGRDTLASDAPGEPGRTRLDDGVRRGTRKERDR